MEIAVIPHQLMTHAELSQAILDRLEDAVVTSGCDKGVVMLSDHGTTHTEVVEGKSVQVYDNRHFSPLGDALIDVYEGLEILSRRLREQPSC
jgi:hypothetical protein